MQPSSLESNSGATVFADTSIVVDNKIVSFGNIDISVKQNEMFTFKLTNVSDSIVHINKIDLSCSCLKVISYPQTLNPGVSGIINGEINLKGQTGHIRKSLFVNYNANSVIMLKIIANIK